MRINVLEHRNGYCVNHRSESVPGHVLCRLCLLRMRLAYQRRAAEPITRVCLRCGTVARHGRKCRGRLCWKCNRTLGTARDDARALFGAYLYLTYGWAAVVAWRSAGSDGAGKPEQARSGVSAGPAENNAVDVCRWVDTGDDVFESACGYEPSGWEQRQYRYCPFCGRSVVIVKGQED